MPAVDITAIDQNSNPSNTFHISKFFMLNSMSIIIKITCIAFFLYKVFGSGTLPGLMLDLGLFEII